MTSHRTLRPRHRRQALNALRLPVGVFGYRVALDGSILLRYLLSFTWQVLVQVGGSSVFRSGQPLLKISMETDDLGEVPEL